MRKVGIVLLVLGWMAVMNADQISSVGFEDNKKLDDLLKFRLPDWGYSTWTLSFYGDGGMTDENRNNDLTDEETDLNTGNHYLSLNPGYRYYRESDDRVFSANVYLRVYFDIIKYKKETHRIISLDTDDDQDTKELDQNYYAYYTAEYSKYFSGRHYLNFYLYQRGSYSDIEEKESGTTSYKRFGYGVNNSVSVGYGFGKLRNVTPILRALRFTERFRALGYDHLFSSDEIQCLANQFAKYSGYQTVYSRHGKYFWDDLFKGIPAISQLKTFDYFYLADVLNEPLNDRFEGWKVETGMRYDQRKVSDNSNNREAGVYLSGEWSKNLDLDHDLVFKGEGVYNFFNKTKQEAITDIKNSLEINLHGAYLWVLSEKIHWVNGFYVSYDQMKINSASEGDFTEKQLSINPGTSLDYYIENRMNLSAMVDYQYSKYDDKYYKNTFNGFNYSLTFQYYFSHL